MTPAAPPSDDDDFLLLVRFDGYIQCINLSTGDEQWRWNTKDGALCQYTSRAFDAAPPNGPTCSSPAGNSNPPSPAASEDRQTAVAAAPPPPSTSSALLSQPALVNYGAPVLLAAFSDQATVHTYVLQGSQLTIADEHRLLTHDLLVNSVATFNATDSAYWELSLRTGAVLVDGVDDLTRLTPTTNFSSPSEFPSSSSSSPAEVSRSAHNGPVLAIVRQNRRHSGRMRQNGQGVPVVWKYLCSAVTIADLGSPSLQDPSVMRSVTSGRPVALLEGPPSAGTAHDDDRDTDDEDGETREEGVQPPSYLDNSPSRRRPAASVVSDVEVFVDGVYHVEIPQASAWWSQTVDSEIVKAYHYSSNYRGGEKLRELPVKVYDESTHASPATTNLGTATGGSGGGASCSFNSSSGSASSGHLWATQLYIKPSSHFLFVVGELPARYEFRGSPTSRGAPMDLPTNVSEGSTTFRVRIPHPTISPVGRGAPSFALTRSALSQHTDPNKGQKRQPQTQTSSHQQQQHPTLHTLQRVMSIETTTTETITGTTAVGIETDPSSQSRLLSQEEELFQSQSEIGDASTNRSRTSKKKAPPAPLLQTRKFFSSDEDEDTEDETETETSATSKWLDAAEERTTTVLGTPRTSSHTSPALAKLQTKSFFNDHFEALRLLGQGASGVVLLAQHRVTGILYAVKVVIMTNDDDTEDDVIKEVKVHAPLQSDYVVRYHSCWAETVTKDRAVLLSKMIREATVDNRLMIGNESMSCATESIVDDDEEEYDDGDDVKSYGKGTCTTSQTGTVFQAIGRRAMFIQMEYCHATLAQYLSRRPSVSRVENMALMLQILHGLEYLHQRGIVHRDLKPMNVMMILMEGTEDESTADPLTVEWFEEFSRCSRQEGEREQRKRASPARTASDDDDDDEDEVYRPPFMATLGDLGLAKWEQSSSVGDVVGFTNEFERHTVGVGSPLYSSPEQLEGKKCQGAADVFSLGVMMVEMYIQPSTASERITTLTRARQGVVDETLLAACPELSVAIGMVHRNADRRMPIRKALKQIRNVLKTLVKLD